MNPQKENGRKSIRDNIAAVKDKGELFRWTGHVESEVLSNATKKTHRRWREALAKKAKELDKPTKK